MTSAAQGRPNGERDTFMVDACAGWNMKLISRDEGAKKKARARGVQAFLPEAWAEAVAPRSLAEHYFTRRLNEALNIYSERCSTGRRSACDQTVTAVRALYAYIWRPAGPAKPFTAESLFR